MAKNYFVTSTGTGVGKTYVTAALIRQARAQGLRVEAYKPVISGFDKAEIAASDAGVILDALGRPLTMPEVERLSPWRFAAPLAPSMAAKKEGRTIDCEALFAHSRAVLHERADLTLIEGVGGVMVPLDDDNTVLDWIAAAGAPVLLVVGDYLGTISHTLTALEVLRMRNIEVAAIVLNEGVEASVPFEETMAEVATRANNRLVEVRRGGDGASLAELCR
jgi:dethiobiotin synthetase